MAKCQECGDKLGLFYSGELCPKCIKEIEDEKHRELTKLKNRDNKNEMQ